MCCQVYNWSCLIKAKQLYPCGYVGGGNGIQGEWKKDHFDYTVAEEPKPVEEPVTSEAVLAAMEWLEGETWTEIVRRIHGD